MTTDKEIIERLNGVISALDNVSCKGVQNLLNLGGSIGILSEIVQALIQRQSKTEE